ncbi:putative pentatricopeptide repeat-containing protein [Tripterygium wilfordii]|uniref:Putative pentatricopeptide repeat-containing protein n=1 Tax=Tripterygium wilfordii TaxID=458696 RepID=A0A7J7DIG8_TRIWF|nr:putative pentatricopeptide repeat-containing protein [Tripterygium wilfordii]
MGIGFYHKMLKDGLFPSTVTLITMKEKGLSRENAIYNSLLAAHCRNVEVEPAIQIFNVMTMRGFEPRLSIYKVLVCALCKENRVEEAQSLFTGMLEKNFSSDEIVWTILVDGLLKEGESDLCMKLLHLVECRNYTLSVTTYKIMAREHCKVDKLVETDQIGHRLRVLWDIG